MSAAASVGGPAAEHVVHYFAVVGAELEGVKPCAGDCLSVKVLQRYPLEDSVNLRFPPSLVSFCFPRGGATAVAPEDFITPTLHGFVLTNEASERCYGAALHLWEEHPFTGAQVPKALAVVGLQPLWSAFYEFLCSVAQTSRREALVVNFLAETPLPPPGFSVHVRMQAGPTAASDLPFVLRRPAPNQLPLLDLPLRLIFERLKPENVVLIVEALLLERRVILCSTHLSLLSAVGEALVGLIWPLRLAAVYVPLLPNALVDFCGAPMPLIVGIDSQMVDRAEAICEPHTIFVDVDASRVRTAGRDHCTSVFVDLASACSPDQNPVGPGPPPPERPHRKLLNRVSLAMQGVDFQAKERSARSFLPLPRGHPPAPAPIKRSPSDSSISTRRGSESSVSSRPGVALPWRTISGGSNTTSSSSALPSTPETLTPDGRFQWLEAGRDSRSWQMADAADSSHVLAQSGSCSSLGVTPAESSTSETEPDALLRMAFLWFMTDLLVDHAKFIGPRHDGGFDRAGFLAHRLEADRPYLQELTSTQMWAMWITRRQDPGPCNGDSKDVLLFDDIINQKLNRKTTTLKKFATPLLNNHFWNCHETGDHYVVPEPVDLGAEAPGARSQLSWNLDCSKLPTPRPLPNLQASLSLPARLPSRAPRADGASARDPLQPQHRAPLQWYVSHCWLLTWAAFLPGAADDPALQWAKMDMCLAVLHRMAVPAEQRVDWPPPHDVALSLLAAACARCGAARVDLARRLFTWMRARQLGAATHPQSTAVFFERFVQLCASDPGRGQSATPSAPARRLHVERSAGSIEKVARMAEARVAEDLCSQPRPLLAASPSASRLTLTQTGSCPECSGPLKLQEVLAQWARPGAEETGSARCQLCGKQVQVCLEVSTPGAPSKQVALLHPKRLAEALHARLGGNSGPTGPECLAGLAAEDFPAWASLVWHFRSASLFSEHLVAALGEQEEPGALAYLLPESALQPALCDGATRLPLPPESAGSEVSPGQESMPEAWETLELPLDTLPAQHKGWNATSSTAASTPSTVAAGGVPGQAIERLRMEREDLLVQLTRRGDGAEGFSGEELLQDAAAEWETDSTQLERKDAAAMAQEQVAVVPAACASDAAVRASRAAWRGDEAREARRCLGGVYGRAVVDLGCSHPPPSCDAGAPPCAARGSRASAAVTELLGALARGAWAQEWMEAIASSGALRAVFHMRSVRATGSEHFELEEACSPCPNEQPSAESADAGPEVANAPAQRASSPGPPPTAPAPLARDLETCSACDSAPEQADGRWEADGPVVASAGSPITATCPATEEAARCRALVPNLGHAAAAALVDGGQSCDPEAAAAELPWSSRGRAAEWEPKGDAARVAGGRGLHAVVVDDHTRESSPSLATSPTAAQKERRGEGSAVDASPGGSPGSDASAPASWHGVGGIDEEGREECREAAEGEAASRSCGGPSTALEWEDDDSASSAGSAGAREEHGAKSQEEVVADHATTPTGVCRPTDDSASSTGAAGAGVEDGANSQEDVAADHATPAVVCRPNDDAESSHGVAGDGEEDRAKCLQDVAADRATPRGVCRPIDDSASSMGAADACEEDRANCQDEVAADHATPRGFCRPTDDSASSIGVASDGEEDWAKYQEEVAEDHATPRAVCRPTDASGYSSGAAGACEEDIAKCQEDVTGGHDSGYCSGDAGDGDEARAKCQEEVAEDHDTPRGVCRRADGAAASRGAGGTNEKDDAEREVAFEGESTPRSASDADGRTPGADPNAAIGLGTAECSEHGVLASARERTLGNHDDLEESAEAEAEAEAASWYIPPRAAGAASEDAASELSHSPSFSIISEMRSPESYGGLECSAAQLYSLGEGRPAMGAPGRERLEEAVSPSDQDSSISPRRSRCGETGVAGEGAGCPLDLSQAGAEAESWTDPDVSPSMVLLEMEGEGRQEAGAEAEASADIDVSRSIVLVQMEGDDGQEAVGLTVQQLEPRADDPANDGCAQAETAFGGEESCEDERARQVPRRCALHEFSDSESEFDAEDGKQWQQDAQAEKENKKSLENSERMSCKGGMMEEEPQVAGEEDGDSQHFRDRAAEVGMLSIGAAELECCARDVAAVETTLAAEEVPLGSREVALREDEPCVPDDGAEMSMDLDSFCDSDELPILFPSPKGAETGKCIGDEHAALLPSGGARGSTLGTSDGGTA